MNSLAEVNSKSPEQTHLRMRLPWTMDDGRWTMDDVGSSAATPRIYNMSFKISEGNEHRIRNTLVKPNFRIFVLLFIGGKGRRESFFVW